MMNFEEKPLESELIYNGKILKVYKDSVEISDGHKSFREVVRHSGGVVVVAFKNENTILMVKQFRYPLGKTMLELPAGKLEKDENPLLAAQRELEEETGYCANTWKSLGFINTSPGYSDEKLYLYLAQDLHYTNCHPDEGEIIQSFEYNINDVLKMIIKNEINDAKTLCVVAKCILEGVIKYDKNDCH